MAEEPEDAVTPEPTPDEAASTGAPEPTSDEAAGTGAPEPTSDEAASTDAPASTGTDAPASGGSAREAAAPAEVLPPKERRRQARAAKAAAVPARSETSPEERQAERDAERRRKAQIRSARRKRGREKVRSSAGTATEPLAPRREKHPGQQKTRQGIVVSDRASKTIIVRIDVARRHRSYDKVVRTSTTLHAHDEREDAHIGDTVVVRESRPLSRSKRWRLVEVLERAK